MNISLSLTKYHHYLNLAILTSMHFALSVRILIKIYFGQFFVPSPTWGATTLTKTLIAGGVRLPAFLQEHHPRLGPSSLELRPDLADLAVPCLPTFELAAPVTPPIAALWVMTL